MSDTFNFEELDDATREYLVAARDSQGKGMPGMFAATKSQLAGCGCLTGLVLVPLTLVATLTDWIGVVYSDPIAVAFLQTAGLLLGGWLILSHFRGKGRRGDSRTAGLWAYMDALHLYVAYQEQVTITPVEEMIDASFTHNYNNGTYQNSVVKIVLSDAKSISLTLNKEVTAERFVTFVNYLTWARHSEESEVGKLPPTSLGAVARYVAKHDVEPKDATGAISLDLLNLEIDEIPVEPKREGRASLSILPYIIMIISRIALFCTFAFAVNPPLRDEAIYTAVIKFKEPRDLRAYLVDERNVLHRKEVTKALSDQYQPVLR